MYTAYGDESADETKQRVFALSGLFGSESDWGAFRDKRWWFLVVWLTRFGKDAPNSMRLYAEDLPTFSLFTRGR